MPRSDSSSGMNRRVRESPMTSTPRGRPVSLGAPPGPASPAACMRRCATEETNPRSTGSHLEDEEVLVGQDRRLLDQAVARRFHLAYHLLARELVLHLGTDRQRPLLPV